MKKKYNVSFYYLIFLIISLILVPKSLSTILGFIPTRLGLIYLWFLILIYELIKKKIKLNTIKLKPFVIVFSLFIASTLFGFFNAVDKILFLYTIAKFLCFGSLIFFIVKYPFEKKQINILLKTVLACALVLAIYSIFQYIFDIDIGKSGVYKYPGAIGRVDATFHNPIYFAMFLLSIIILCFYEITKSVSLKENVIYFSQILISIVSILLTFTRSVYILLVFVLIFVFALSFFKKYKKKSLFLFLPFIFLISALYFVPGAKYAYASSAVQVLPKKISVEFLKFANQFLFTNIDTNLYFTEKIIEKEKKPTNTNTNTNNNNTNTNTNTNNNNTNTNTNTNNKKDEPKIDYEVKDDASLNSRDNYKGYAEEVIKDYQLTGIGMGNYEKFILANSSKYIPNGAKFGYPHNSIIHLRAEAGIIGTIIFCTIIIGTTLLFLINSILKRSSEYLFLTILWCNLLILTQLESLFYDAQLLPLLLIITALVFRSFDDSKNKKKSVVFISSVGGHLTQMLQLKEIFNNYNYVLVTEKTDVTKKIKKTYNTNYLLYGSREYLFSYIFKFVFNILKSIYLFFKYNPEVIVTTGTHTAVPICYIAWIFRRKVIFIESFAKNKTPTLSGRLVYPIATIFVVQWEQMKECYPKSVYWGGIY